MKVDSTRDDAYRAVGRYVVEFSRLIAHMRVGIERYLAVDEDRTVPALALGSASADQIAQVFFAVCEHLADLNESEMKVSGRLKVEVLDEIKRRNDFAHGDWLLGGMVGDIEHPVLARVKPGRRRGPVQTREIPVVEIDTASDEAFTLRQKVAEFGALCLGTHPFDQGKDRFKVRHAFKVEGRDVLRTTEAPIYWQ